VTGAAGNGLPFVSVLIPTLNSARTLAACLDALKALDYPRDRFEIIVADGGSVDATVALAREHGATVVPNPRVTGEAGKAAALRAARGELVALIDSDNIVVGRDWLRRMVAPFADAAIVGSEPIAFSALPSDTLVDRYCAIFGVNDPLCLFLGNYDRECAATGRWTGLAVDAEDRGDYIAVALDRRLLPTFGANGTLYRRAVLAPYVGDDLMDVDVPVRIGADRPGLRFAKVRTSIRHLFCRDVAAFARKQTRRIRDFCATPKSAGARAYPWDEIIGAGVVRFALACVTVVPLLLQSARAYGRTGDAAAFFHPIACWMTLWVYGSNVLFARGRALDRRGWRQ
jgi:glycosyltransferase involved in cell wall biosynthesis